jgi:hypothetical protein
MIRSVDTHVACGKKGDQEIESVLYTIQTVSLNPRQLRKAHVMLKCRYLFEIYLNPSDKDYSPPKPNDDEVESFRLMPVSDVIHLLQHNPDCFPPYVRLLLLHFCINHSIITSRNEAAFVEMCQRLKQGVGKCAQALTVGRWMVES